MSQRITITRLAEMIRDGFADQDRRINGNINELRGEVRELTRRFDTHEVTVNGHENRISYLEDSIGVVKNKLGIRAQNKESGLS